MKKAAPDKVGSAATETSGTKEGTGANAMVVGAMAAPSTTAATAPAIAPFQVSRISPQISSELPAITESTASTSAVAIGFREREDSGQQAIANSAAAPAGSILGFFQSLRGGQASDSAGDHREAKTGVEPLVGNTDTIASACGADDPRSNDQQMSPQVQPI